MPRLKFRHRIGLLVGLAAGALTIVAVVTLVLGRRNQREVRGIETRYLPLIELDRDLKTTFGRIPHALQDAASAADEARLQDADSLEQALLQGIEAGGETIRGNGGNPAALQEGLRRYYQAARELASLMMSGAPAAALGPKVEAMTQAQQSFASELDLATTPDRRKMAEAFQAARATQTLSLRIDLAVAGGALLLMSLLSIRLTRHTVTALAAVSAGVERLASGELQEEIEVPAGDELGDLARQANLTGTRLRELREREHTLLEETQRQAAALEAANKELESFSYSVSHDLRSPLRAIDGFSQALLEDYQQELPPKGQDYLRRTRAAAQRMSELIDDLLRLSRVTRADFRRERVDLSAMATLIAEELRRTNRERQVDLQVEPGVTAQADPRLVRIALENLLGNAWKFTSRAEAPRIEFGVASSGEGRAYFVRDNGAGFDMKYATNLFGAFQRLHSDKEFPGTGIGLATVQRIVHRHGGRIWVDAAVSRGATFHFTLTNDRGARPS